MSRVGEHAAEREAEEQQALPDNLWFVVQDGAILDSYPDFAQANAAALLVQRLNPRSAVSVETY